MSNDWHLCINLYALGNNKYPDNELHFIVENGVPEMVCICKLDKPIKCHYARRHLYVTNLTV